MLMATTTPPMCAVRTPGHHVIGDSRARPVHVNDQLRDIASLHTTRANSRPMKEA
jgi:hypothetical protein